VPAIYAGIAGIELMQEIGVAETREHVLDSTPTSSTASTSFGRGGHAAKTKRRGALICVRSKDANALVAALGREGIVTSERDGNVRISAHCYNTVEDVDAVLASLQRTNTCWRRQRPYSISAMARARKSTLERLQERIRTADRGWFFAAVADQVAERRQAKGSRSASSRSSSGRRSPRSRASSAEAAHHASTRYFELPMPLTATSSSS
jgi:hypothetical protein